MAYVEGKYERAMGHGVEVQPLLYEVWGGWAPPVVDLMERSARERGNKLRKHEYDERDDVGGAQRGDQSLGLAASYGGVD